MNGYITAQEAADKWGITVRQVQSLCKQNRVKGAVMLSRIWLIPEKAEKPTINRIRKPANTEKEIMDLDIQHYYEVVKYFCAFIEELSISENRLEELMSLLLLLYENALHLPDTEPGEVDYALEEMTFLPLKIEIRDFYWDIYDPFDDAEKDKLVCGMISDDINDIYRDLQEGVRAYEAGDKNTAAWIWKFGVNGHWGTHTVNLIKALHWMRTAHGTS